MTPQHRRPLSLDRLAYQNGADQTGACRRPRWVRIAPGSLTPSNAPRPLDLLD